MRVLSILLFIGIVLLFTGCATKPAPVQKEKVVVEVKNIYHTPPETLLRDCTISAPPKPENYIKRSYKEKEAMLVKYAAEQTVNLSDCNKDKAALRKWKSDKEAESK